jgi:multidrug efflux pump subunit AcrA (membrane-fusion protein)
MRRSSWILTGAVLIVLASLLWGGLRVARLTAGDTRSEIPVTQVKKGAVTIIVTARGDLRGGNSEVLTAPMAGGGEMAIIYLREPGDAVRSGDVVARFDPTQQEFNLAEARADLAEAEEQVKKAKADAEASLEEARYQLLSTTSELKQAEIEVRKNPVLARITARQNDIALEAAQNRQKQAEKDYENRKATAAAGIAMQNAAVDKARAIAENAQRTIDSLVLRAKTTGYVHIQPNSNQNDLFYGQQLPPYHVGDATRAGQAVAQIPDMSSWEVLARIPESDRGYLASGQRVSVRVAAIPGREFKAHVTSVGASTGSSWERTFECRIKLDEGAPELRPGMTSNIVITVESLDNVLWVPSQALFEIDGRSFIYTRTADGFAARDVTLVRRSESQAVISGVSEGSVVALSNPEHFARNRSDGHTSGAMKALGK